MNLLRRAACVMASLLGWTLLGTVRCSEPSREAKSDDDQ